MRQTLLMLLLAVLCLSWLPTSAQAASEAECSIWLCLPGGFPSGCGAAYKAFQHRIKHHQTPLPSLSSCTDGPDETKTEGRYETGYEAYENCKDGYRLYQYSKESHMSAMCYPSDCSPGQYQPGKGLCDGYTAVKRTHPRYVKIWVKGEYLGQYWY